MPLPNTQQQDSRPIYNSEQKDNKPLQNISRKYFHKIGNTCNIDSKAKKMEVNFKSVKLIGAYKNGILWYQTHFANRTCKWLLEHSVCNNVIEFTKNREPEGGFTSF